MIAMFTIIILHWEDSGEIGIEKQILINSKKEEISEILLAILFTTQW